MKKLSLLLVTLLVAFAGCKKDNAQNSIDNQSILAYIKANNLTAKSTGSGLYYVVTAPGDATRANSTSTVYVKYRGYLLDGTQFDSSYELSEQPAQLTLASLIPGFQEGLKLFGQGGKGILLIPSSLAYKDAAYDAIPANSVLIFNFEIVKIQ